MWAVHTNYLNCTSRKALFKFRSSLSIATSFSRFALLFSPMEQFLCDSWGNFCIVSLSHTLFWPYLACPPDWCGWKRPPYHLTLYARGQFIALNHDPNLLEEVATVFLVDSEKDWKTVFKLGGRTVDLLWADVRGNRYSVQCFSLVTLG